MSRLFILPLIAALAGCGVESLESAAVAAKAKEQEVRAAQQMQEDMQKRLDAAAQVEQQRLDEAEKSGY